MLSSPLVLLISVAAKATAEQARKSVPPAAAANADRWAARARRLSSAPYSGAASTTSS